MTGQYSAETMAVSSRAAQHITRLTAPLTYGLTCQLPLIGIQVSLCCTLTYTDTYAHRVKGRHVVQSVCLTNPARLWIPEMSPCPGVHPDVCPVPASAYPAVKPRWLMASHDRKSIPVPSWTTAGRRQVHAKIDCKAGKSIIQVLLQGHQMTMGSLRVSSFSHICAVMLTLPVVSHLRRHFGVEWWKLTILHCKRQLWQAVVLTSPCLSN